MQVVHDKEKAANCNASGRIIAMLLTCACPNHPRRGGGRRALAVRGLEQSGRSLRFLEMVKLVYLGVAYKVSIGRTYMYEQLI